jgi:hypothetical protein
VNRQLPVDGQNLNNVLDVIDFGGLFSGNTMDREPDPVPRHDF